MPDWLPPAVKEAWVSLAEPARQALADRQAETAKLAEQHGALRAGLDKIAEALSPVRDMMAAGTLRPEQYIKDLVQWERSLATDPAGTIVALARQAGVDLASLAAGVPPQEQQQQQISARLQMIERRIQEEEQQRVHSTIAAFAKGKPHFETVRRVMGALLTTGQAESLQDAYDRAVWASPEAREAILQERQAEEMARRAQASATAKNAAAVNVRGGIPPSAGNGSLDDALRDTYRRVMSS